MSSVTILDGIGLRHMDSTRPFTTAIGTNIVFQRRKKRWQATGENGTGSGLTPREAYKDYLTKCQDYSILNRSGYGKR